MGLFVNTNVSSINAQRQLFNSGNQLSTAFEQLSSGFRINRAADDAAGLQISDRMTSQVNGLSQAVRNANDGVSLTQTAEGALQETTRNLQRLRQLAVQAQNGINSSSDKEALQKEADELLNEINRIADTTQFAGNNLLGGDFSASFLVGANAGQSINVGLTQFSGAGFGVSGLGINGLNITTGTVGAGGSSDNLANVTSVDSRAAGGNIFVANDADIGTMVVAGTYNVAVSTDGGATYNEITFDFVANDAQASFESLRDALSTVGVASTVSSGAFWSITNGGTAFDWAERTDNPQLNVFFGSYDPPASGGGSTNAIDAIDGAISRVGGVRADLGATQNRFQSTIRNLSNIVENISSSRSRIRDTDFASATADLTKNQIIQQASTSILAQANQRPQAALSLLG